MRVSISIILITACFLLPTSCEEDQQSHQSSLKASLQVRPLIFPAGSGIASLNFQLNNTVGQKLDTRPASWLIIVDTSPFRVERRTILRVPLDGPQPIGGWGTLTPGGSYSFCKTVDLANAMREPGKYAIWWKGENFQSVPVTVQVRHQ
jgi:hypothetical protein